MEWRGGRSGISNESKEIYINARLGGGGSSFLPQSLKEKWYVYGRAVELDEREVDVWLKSSPSDFASVTPAGASS